VVKNADAVAEQIVALLAPPTEERTREFARSIGDLIQRDPDRTLLRRLRGEAAAWIDRTAGEGPPTPDTSVAVATVAAVAGVLGGYLEAEEPVADSELLRLRVLKILNDQRQARPSEIADLASRGRPQISTVLRHLREEGLVEDSDSPLVDGRATMYTLTDKGAAAIRGAEPRDRAQARSHAGLERSQRMPTMAKSRQTSKQAAKAAGKTLGSKSASKSAKSAAGSALTQTGSRERTSTSASKAAAKTLRSKSASKAAKSAAGSALSQRATGSKKRSTR
jgi:DNA-binding MarR family transcriptional regulator